MTSINLGMVNILQQKGITKITNTKDGTTVKNAKLNELANMDGNIPGTSKDNKITEAEYQKVKGNTTAKAKQYQALADGITNESNKVVADMCNAIRKTGGIANSKVFTDSVLKSLVKEITLNEPITNFGDFAKNFCSVYNIKSGNETALKNLLTKLATNSSNKSETSNTDGKKTLNTNDLCKSLGIKDNATNVDSIKKAFAGSSKLINDDIFYVKNNKSYANKLTVNQKATKFKTTINTMVNNFKKLNPALTKNLTDKQIKSILTDLADQMQSSSTSKSVKTLNNEKVISTMYRRLGLNNTQKKNFTEANLKTLIANFGAPSSNNVQSYDFCSLANVTRNNDNADFLHIILKNDYDSSIDRDLGK